MFNDIKIIIKIFFFNNVLAQDSEPSLLTASFRMKLFF